jgi:hypothetical protein
MFGDGGIDVGRRCARPHDIAHQLVGLPDAQPGLPHEGDFTIRFEIEHRVLSPS